VFVGPRCDDEVLTAVREGGGEPVQDPAEAEAFVWLDHNPSELQPLLTDRVGWVQLPWAGVEQWMAQGVIDEARVWTCASEAYGTAVAEHVVALMLAGRRRLHRAARATSWDTSNGGQPLFGATMVVVGTGSIGRGIVRLLEPWGMTMIGVSRTGRPVEGFARVVAVGELRDVLPDADVVVRAAPATPDTAGLVGPDELAAMREDAWLVNVARGSLVDTDALVAALASGSIGGAALDVTDPEPLPDGHPLWTEPRALITPHRANFRRRRAARAVHPPDPPLDRGRGAVGAGRSGAGVLRAGGGPRRPRPVHET
jgi:D-3-phosphoglycerate dehydrogenase